MIVSSHGPESVAALGVEKRLQDFLLLVLQLSQLFLFLLFVKTLDQTTPKDWRRLSLYSKIFKFLGISCTFFLSGLSLPISFLFSNDETVQISTQVFLLTTPISFLFMGFTMCTASLFNGLMKQFQATLINVLRLFSFFVPSALLGSFLFDFTGCCVSLAFGNIFQFFVRWSGKQKH